MTTCRINRRQFLQLGGYSALALQLNLAWKLAEAQAAPAPGNALAPAIDACILLVYYGGPSHLDTWDMKPEAPAEVRGLFRPIATNVPGRFVCEHLPRTAQVVDKLAVIRTMHHPMTNHNSAMFETLAGRTPVGGDLDVLGSDRKNDFPSYGSALSYLIASGQMPEGRLPLPHVALPHVMHNVVPLPGQNAGFLDASYDPLQITRDPNRADFRVDELQLPADMPVDRLRTRRRLLARFSDATGSAPRSAAATAIASYRQRAFDLLSSPRTRQAFRMAEEPEGIRQRYGRHTLGQSLLLARRLVQAGVRMVNVNDKIFNGQLANWDSHQNNFPRHKDDLLPPADQAFSALIEDLDARGMLASTLVIAMGEFGRTPRINANAGRDHWPHCYSVVLAGGGVRGGATYGTSDRLAAYPASDPVTPGDLAATLFWRFGIDHTLEIHDPLGRPFRLATGEPLRRLFQT